MEYLGRERIPPARRTLMRWGHAGSAPWIDFFTMNIDAQDEQDEQDERFLHEKPAWQMIRFGFRHA